MRIRCSAPFSIAPLAYLRWVMGAMLIVLLIAAGTPLDLQAQDADAIAQQVTVDMHGPDRQGKDGPLVKVGQQLATLYRRYEQYEKSGRRELLRPPSSAMHVSDEYVVIDATATESATALRNDLEALGLREAAQVDRLVSGYLPISAIPEMANLSTLQGARPALATTQTGATTSQGSPSMRADVARQDLGVDGSGVTVGVLSDSYDTDPSASTSASDDIASGDLPPASRINVLDDFDGGTDEGRAMMQIIHDVSPGADQAFHTAFNGLSDFAQGIRDLANAGADIIVDDVIYFAEPFFQDGPIAVAANDVVREQGVAYFTSAGNNGSNSYQSPFQGSGESGVLSGRAELHDFGGGDTTQELIIPEDDSVRIVLQWTDPFASFSGSGADSDVDIFLQDQSGDVIAESSGPNVGGDPFEFLEFTNDGSIDADNDGTPDTRFNLGLELFEGPEPEIIKYIYFASSGVQISEHQGDSQSPTLYGHANAEEAAAVGAVFWFATPEFDDTFTNPFAVNNYSAVGGVPIYFTPEGDPLPSPDVRQKPEIVGPDGGNTTFFGQELNDGEGGQPDGFPNFFGTSAAAPHVAAVAALMREFDPQRAAAQIYEDMQSTAIDMTEFLVDPANNTTASIPNGDEFDFYSGFGLVQADEAVPLAAEVVRFDAVRAGGGNTVEVSWEETGSTEIEEYVLERQYFDGPFEPIATLPSDGTPPQVFTFETENLGLGRYTFRLRWRRSDGTMETSPQQPTITVELIDFTAEIVGEDENDVELSWTVPAATSGFTYAVQYRAGETYQTADSTTGRSFTIESLQPGRYEFRLRMRDDQGNALFSRTLNEDIPLDGEVALSAAYNNPFTRRVHLDITARTGQTVQVRMYNTAGQLVKYRFERLDPLVPTTLTLDVQEDLASGKYFIQVRGDTFTESRSAVHVR